MNNGKAVYISFRFKNFFQDKLNVPGPLPLWTMYAMYKLMTLSTERL